MACCQARETSIGLEAPFRQPDVESSASAATMVRTLAWHDVNFTVNKGSDSEKMILEGVSGEFSGMCAIMGPSGAGKSSLLNVLAGRSATNNAVEVKAEVTIGGARIDPVQFRQNVAYVMQDDALVPTATPREALDFSAYLRLGRMDYAERAALVEELLERLNLTSCADVLIGGEMIQGISGGQRKRTSVGVELITNPKILFLDEPTSGLDSESALSCVTLLKNVAQQGTTVLCTIHQPSSEVFELFGSVVLMKDGRVVFSGPKSRVVSYFAEKGFPVPEHHNPADFVMSVACTHSTEELVKLGFCEQPTLSLPTSDTPPESMVISSSFGTQLAALLYRDFQQSSRDYAALGGRFGVTIFLSVLFGLIFEGSNGRDNANPDNLNSAFGALVMVTISCMFGCAQPVMLGFPIDRPIFMREYATGTYSVLAYFLSKAALEMPLALLQSVFTFCIVHPLLDLQGDFVTLVGASFLLGVVSSSLAVVLGCIVPDLRTVGELGPLLFVPQLLFAGLFVRISQIPGYLQWVQYTCGLKYGINLIIMTELSDCGATSATPTVANTACANFLSIQDIKRDEWHIYVGIMLIIMFVTRSIGMAILQSKAVAFY